MERVVMKSYVSLLSTFPRCWQRHEHDKNHGSQETLPRFGDEREETNGE